MANFFSLKKLFIIIVLFIFFSYLKGQDINRIIPPSSLPKQIDDITYILKSIQTSFYEAIIDGTIPNDVSLTKIVTYGFERNQIQYIDNVLESIFLEDISFRIIKIDKTFIERQLEENLPSSEGIIKGVKNNSEYFEITKSAGNNNFIEFYFYRFKNKLLVRVFVHDAKTSEVIWNEEWSVETRVSNFIFNLVLYNDLASFPINVSIFDSETGGAFFDPVGNKEILLGFFLGGRQVGFGNYGALIKLGASYKEFPNFELSILAFIGPKIALNLFELSRWKNYYGINLYLTIEIGALLQTYIISTDSSKTPFFPTTLISSSIGFEVDFDSLYILGIYFDIFQFDLELSFGFSF